MGGGNHDIECPKNRAQTHELLNNHCELHNQQPITMKAWRLPDLEKTNRGG